MEVVTGLTDSKTQLFYNRKGLKGRVGIIIPFLGPRPPHKKLKQCGWLQWYRICTLFAHALQGIPFYLSFDRVEGKWKIRTSRFRKMIYICFQITKTVCFISWLRLTIADVRSSHDIIKYFDLTVIMGYSSFDYPFVYIWLCRLKPVEEFFEELQSSPLLKISNPASTWQVVAYTILIIWYIGTYIPYYLPRWEIYTWSLEGWYEATKIACETYFGVPQAWEGRIYYPPLLVIGFIICFHQIEFFIFGDLMSLSGILTMYHIAADLDRALKDPTLTESEIFELIAAQKRLTKKFNEAFGFLVCTYVLYCSPYYSLHFVDIFSASGWMGLLETSTYVGVLAWACKMGMDIGILTERRQRWINARCVTIAKADLTWLLDDIMSSKFCLGSFFQVNAGVTGEIVGLLLTVAVIRVQTLGTGE